MCTSFSFSFGLLKKEFGSSGWIETLRYASPHCEQWKKVEYAQKHILNKWSYHYENSIKKEWENLVFVEIKNSLW